MVAVFFLCAGIILAIFAIVLHVFFKEKTWACETSSLSITVRLSSLLSFIAAFISHIVSNPADFTWVFYTVLLMLGLGVIGSFILIIIGIGNLIDGVKWGKENANKAKRGMEMTFFISNGFSMIGTGFFMLLFWGGVLIYFLKCFNLI
jgi:hypothetical protein